MLSTIKISILLAVQLLYFLIKTFSMPKIFAFAGKLFLVSSLLVSLKSFAGSDKKGLPDDKNRPSLFSNPANAPVIKRSADSIYDLIGLGNYGLEKDIFFNAYKGYEYLQYKGFLKKTNLLTICDYSQSSNNKRLYVIDLANGRLLFNTYVSHGRNSGNEFATSFSNFNNSNKSSLGFVVTGDAYSGKAGYSLYLNGMEPGINDKMRSRSIVLHGSKFVNDNVMAMRGMIGRSLGCPAVPYGIHFKIINTIKGGSCVFINHPDEWYAHTSAILNASFDLSPSAPSNNVALQDASNSSSTEVSSTVTVVK